MYGGWDLGAIDADGELVFNWFKQRYKFMSAAQEASLRSMIQKAALYDYYIIDNEPLKAYKIYEQIVAEKPVEEALQRYDQKTRRTLFDKIREVAHYAGLTGDERKTAKQKYLKSQRVPRWWGSALGEYTGIFTPSGSKATKLVRKIANDPTLQQLTPPKRRQAGWDIELWNPNEAMGVYNLSYPDRQMTNYSLSELAPRTQKSGRRLTKNAFSRIRGRCSKTVSSEVETTPEATAAAQAALAAVQTELAAPRRRRRRNAEEEDALGATASAAPAPAPAAASAEEPAASVQVQFPKVVPRAQSHPQVQSLPPDLQNLVATADPQPQAQPPAAEPVVRGRPVERSVAGIRASSVRGRRAGKRKQEIRSTSVPARYDDIVSKPTIKLRPPSNRKRTATKPFRFR